MSKLELKRILPEDPSTSLDVLQMNIQKLIDQGKSLDDIIEIVCRNDFDVEVMEFMFINAIGGVADFCKTHGQLKPSQVYAAITSMYKKSKRYHDEHPYQEQEIGPIGTGGDDVGQEQQANEPDNKNEKPLDRSSEDLEESTSEKKSDRNINDLELVSVVLTTVEFRVLLSMINILKKVLKKNRLNRIIDLLLDSSGPGVPDKAKDIFRFFDKLVFVRTGKYKFTSKNIQKIFKKIARLTKDLSGKDGDNTIFRLPKQSFLLLESLLVESDKVFQEIYKLVKPAVRELKDRREIAEEFKKALMGTVPEGIKNTMDIVIHVNPKDNGILGCLKDLQILENRYFDNSLINDFLVHCSQWVLHSSMIDMNKIFKGDKEEV